TYGLHRTGLQRTVLHHPTRPQGPRLPAGRPRPGPAGEGRQAGPSDGVVRRAGQTDEARLAAQQRQMIPSSTAKMTSIGTMPLYCCGGAPREPGENAHTGARYSSSTVWPGATATVMAAGPTSEGRKYGTCRLSWCWPGGTGITVRPHVD